MRKMTPHLLNEKELIWSTTVVNNRMNRGRQAFGVNSYEKEIGINIADYIIQHLRPNKTFRWLDACCGEGNALLQVAAYLKENNLQENVSLIGVDLIDFFNEGAEVYDFVRFETQSLVDWTPEGSYDLITCIHGLHYIGDKLCVIKNLINALSEEGMFFASLDIKNIEIAGIEEKNLVKQLFQPQNITLNKKKNLLLAKGGQKIQLSPTYLGAKDNIGPNYTGQPAVLSIYRNFS